MRGEPDILEQVRQREIAENSGADADGTNSEERDKLFGEVAEVVVQHQQGAH